VSVEFDEGPGGRGRGEGLVESGGSEFVHRGQGIRGRGQVHMGRTPARVRKRQGRGEQEADEGEGEGDGEGEGRHDGHGDGKERESEGEPERPIRERSPPSPNTEAPIPQPSLRCTTGTCPVLSTGFHRAASSLNTK
jgi:hypothetical protein